MGFFTEQCSSQPDSCKERGEIENSVEMSSAKPEYLIADNPDVPARTMNLKERPRRQVARRVFRNERTLNENQWL